MTVKEFIGTLESSDRLRIIEGGADVYVGYLATFKPFADHEISEEYRKYSEHEVKKFKNNKDIAAKSACGTPQALILYAERQEI